MQRNQVALLADWFGHFNPQIVSYQLKAAISQGSNKKSLQWSQIWFRPKTDLRESLSSFKLNTINMNYNCLPNFAENFSICNWYSSEAGHIFLLLFCLFFPGELRISHLQLASEAGDMEEVLVAGAAIRAEGQGGWKEVEDKEKKAKTHFEPGLAWERFWVRTYLGKASNSGVIFTTGNFLPPCLWSDAVQFQIHSLTSSSQGGFSI